VVSCALSASVMSRLKLQHIGFKGAINLFHSDGGSPVIYRGGSHPRQHDSQAHGMSFHLVIIAISVLCFLFSFGLFDKGQCTLIKNLSVNVPRGYFSSVVLRGRLY